MTAVPENQQVEKVLKTCFRSDFAEVAESLLPEIHRVDRLPQRLVRFEDSDAYFKTSPVRDGDINDLSDRLWGKGEHFILDFGLHLVGYFRFHLDAEGLNIDAPCRLRLVFGESPLDVVGDMSGVETWISTAWLPDEIINIDFMPEEVRLRRRHAFRYVRIDVIDTSPKYKVKFSECAVKSVSSATGDVELFDFHDPLLETIDEISILTLRDCMQRVFEDGPRRDRRLWIGDLRLQALTCYHTFKDHKLAKRCLFMFAALPREDSSLPACLFEPLKAATDYIVDYDTLFGVIVYDYVVASADVESGHLLWSTILGSLESALSHLDDFVFDSSKTKRWKFLDWAELDTSAGMHGLLLYSLRAIAALAEILQVKFPYHTTIEWMTEKASGFVSHGLIVSGSQISLASAAWLVLSSALPTGVSRAALLAALKHQDTVKPLTPYLYHHIVDAMCSVGLFDEAVALIKTYWGGMVAAGADTFWEAFDAENPRTSPYGDVRNNSFCHAWSCSPSWLLRVRLKDHLEAEVKKVVSLDVLDQRHKQRSEKAVRDTPAGSISVASRQR